jgi:hypothetical protein
MALSRYADLTALRRDVAHAPRKFSDILSGPTQMHTPSRGRLLPEADTGTPFRDRPDRARHQPAPTVGADVEEHGFYAVSAERALIAANPRFRCVGRQILIAAFAVRSQFQHSLVLSRRVCRTPAARRGRFSESVSILW